MKRVLIFIGLKLWEILKVFGVIILTCIGLFVLCQIIYMIGNGEVWLWNLVCPFGIVADTSDSFWVFLANSRSDAAICGVITFFISSFIIVIMCVDVLVVIVKWKSIKYEWNKWISSNWQKAGEIASRRMK